MIYDLIGTIIGNFIFIYIWSTIYNKKIDFKDYKLYIGFLVMTVLILLNKEMNIKILLSLTLLFILFLANYIIFKKSIKETIVSSLVSEIIFIVSEILFTIAIVIIFSINNQTELPTDISGISSLALNIGIASLAFLIGSMKIVIRIHNRLLGAIKFLKTHNYIFIFAFLIFIITTLFYSVYYNNEFSIFLMVVIIVSIIVVMVITQNIINKNNYLEFKSKYNDTINSLKEYEKFLDKYRMENHENKNQLLTIRNMYVNKENDIDRFIEEIIEDKINDDDKLITETLAVPSGGLRAVIYAKLLDVKKHKLNYSLNVTKDINKNKFFMEEEILLKVCKIVGVFLDNAIDEITNMDKGNLAIDIYFEDDKLVISILNNFKDIDTVNIEEIGKTSKGKNHGYGLSLVKDIVKKDHRLINETSVYDDVFIQILKIKK